MASPATGSDGAEAFPLACGAQRAAQLAACSLAAAVQPGDAALCADILRRLADIFGGAGVLTAQDAARALGEDAVSCGSAERADQLLLAAFGEPPELVLRGPLSQGPRISRVRRAAEAEAAAGSGPAAPGGAAGVRLLGQALAEGAEHPGVTALVHAAAPPRRLPASLVACLPALPTSWAVSVHPGGEAVLAVAGPAGGAAELRALLADDAGAAAFGAVGVPGADGEPAVLCHEGIAKAALSVAAAAGAELRASGAAVQRLSCVGHGAAGAVAAVALGKLLRGGGLEQAQCGDVLLLGTAPFLPSAGAAVRDLLPPGAGGTVGWVVADGDPLPFALQPALVRAHHALSVCGVPHSVLGEGRFEWLGRFAAPGGVALLDRRSARHAAWEAARGGEELRIAEIRPLCGEAHRPLRYATLLCAMGGISADLADLAPELAPPADAAVAALDAAQHTLPRHPAPDPARLLRLEREVSDLRGRVRGDAAEGGAMFELLTAELEAARKREDGYRAEIAKWEEERLRRDTALSVMEGQLQSDRRSQRHAQELCDRQARRIAQLEALLAASEKRERGLVERLDGESDSRRTDSLAHHAQEVRLREELQDAARGRGDVAQEADALRCSLQDSEGRRVAAERRATELAAELGRLQQDGAERQKADKAALQRLERGGTEAAAETRQQLAALRGQLRDMRLEADLSGQRASDKQEALGRKAREAEAAAEALRADLRQQHRESAAAFAKARGEWDVDRRKLEIELNTLSQGETMLREQVAALASELQVCQRDLAAARAELQEKERLYVEAASSLRAERVTFQTRIQLQEEELDLRARRLNEQRQEAMRWRDEALARERAQRDEHHTAQKTAADEKHSLETSLDSVQWALSREAEQHAALQKEHAELQQAREAECSELRAEIARLEARIGELDVAVTRNLHYCLLKEQSDKQLEELSYLRNKVTALEDRCRAASVEQSVLGEQRWRDAEDRARAMQVGLVASESRRIGAEAALKGLAPLLADQDIARRVPEGMQRLVDWQAALRPDSPVLTASAMGRMKLGPLPSGASSTLSPSAVVPGVSSIAPSPGSQSAGATPGKAAQLRKAVDSAPYYTVQKTKEVPSIYDLDW